MQGSPKPIGTSRPELPQRIARASRVGVSRSVTAPDEDQRRLAYLNAKCVTGSGGNHDAGRNGLCPRSKENFGLNSRPPVPRRLTGRHICRTPAGCAMFSGLRPGGLYREAARNSRCTSTDNRHLGHEQSEIDLMHRWMQEGEAGDRIELGRAPARNGLSAHRAP
jgi:hypothetical protein